MNTLTIIGAVFIGLSLGLTGAGGSIVTLPVLGVALNMLLGSKREAALPVECRPYRCLSAGLVVGVLTGFIGVGS